MRGFWRVWMDIDQLKLLHVLLDCCEVFQCLQKRLQHSFAVLEDVWVVKSWAVAMLNNMLESPSTGGHEETFLSATSVRDSDAAESCNWHAGTWRLVLRPRKTMCWAGSH